MSEFEKFQQRQETSEEREARIKEQIEQMIEVLSDNIDILEQKQERRDGIGEHFSEEERVLQSSTAVSVRDFFRRVQNTEGVEESKSYFRAVGQWWRYATSLRDGIPPIGDPENADVAIFQAFGRNNIPDEDLYLIGQLREQSPGDLECLEKIVHTGFDAGIPNQDLAKEMRDLMERYNVPAIVQWEVAVAAFIDDPNWTEAQGEKITSVWPPAEKQARFDTTHVKEETARIMQEKDLHMPIEVAHAAMIARAFLIVKKVFGVEPLVVEQRTNSWDKNSIQGQIRGPQKWIPREVLTRVHHLLTRRVW